MKFTTKGNTLYYVGAKIYEAPAEITETFANAFNEETIFLIYRANDLVPDKDIPEVYRKAEPELQEAINQNVLCIDKTGNIVWRIAPTIDLPIDHTRFINNKPGVRQLWVYRSDAREFMIDPQNGKIICWRHGL